MIEFPALSPTHPIKKPDRIIREHQKQPKNEQSPEKKKNEEDLNEPPEQHIDEYI